MQISFYVLGDRFMIHDSVALTNDSSKVSDSTASVVNAEAVLNFVCQLTQTVLKKSDLSLVIVDDQNERRLNLDTQLWSFEPTSFVPHNLVDDDTPQVSQLAAPVTLTSSLPKGFDGVVLNLAASPLELGTDTPHPILPERILEIITPDDISKEQGRHKYRYYQSLGFELKYFPID